MNENKNTNGKLSPEDELDLLLEKFLAEEDPILAEEDADVFLTDGAASADSELPVPAEDTVEAAISSDSLWENIDAEDPTSLLEPGIGDASAPLPEIGPDEAALAEIALSHSAEPEAPPAPEEEVPHWTLEPTAIIPELPRSSQSAPLEPLEPSAEDAEDPLSDPALRALLFEETGSFKDDEFRNTFGEVEEIYSSAPAQPQEPAEAVPEEAAVEAPTEEAAPEVSPMRKRRPKNKRAYGLLGIPHILTTLIWLVLVVAIGASLGRMVWLCAADVLAFGRPDQVVYITITKNDTLDSVAEKLHRAGLISYPGLFKVYGQLSNIMDDLSIGTYELNTLYDYHALSTSMSEKPAMRVTVDVTIPEGYNCAQIFALLEQKEVCSVAELEEYASTSLFKDYWFLEGTERGNKYCLEGFLFPDTYEFYVDSDAKEVYIKLLAAFDNRFTDIMKEKLVKLNETFAKTLKKNGYDQAYIDAHKITIREVVIIASMIEKETSGIEDDSYKISSVIYNRLSNPGKYPYLNIDAALVYALGKNEITAADKLLDSPYNTYKYEGLIPGPISNPGRASLDAALDPLDTKYYYYVLDPSTGTHDYSQTLEEHNAKVDKYLQGNK